MEQVRTATKPNLHCISQACRYVSANVLLTSTCIKLLCCRAEKISNTFKHSFMLATATASDYVVQAACRYFCAMPDDAKNLHVHILYPLEFAIVLSH